MKPIPLIVSAVVLLLMAGCGGAVPATATQTPATLGAEEQQQSASTATPVPPSPYLHFPQQHGEGRSVIYEALLKGELVLENGCIRARTTDGLSDHLLIWPPGFQLSVDGQDVRISNESGVSLTVGQEIRIGGGELRLAHVQPLVEEPVPSDCPGPYWLVGEIPAH